MNIILVWILVISNPIGNGNKMVTYSPPLADLESCQLLANLVNNKSAQCIQVKVIK